MMKTKSLLNRRLFLLVMKKRAAPSSATRDLTYTYRNLKSVVKIDIVGVSTCWIDK